MSVLFPVDVLFSQWFLDKDLVRLLFREKWLALGSGNGDPAVGARCRTASILVFPCVCVCVCRV